MKTDLKRWMALLEAKIIAYHGTGSRIKQFYQPSMTPHYFTPDKEYAMVYSGGKTPLSKIDKPKKQRYYLLTVELDIKHMFDTKDDSTALEIYNTGFLPHINTIRAKYHRESYPELATGKYPSFVYADDLYRYFMRFPSDYDGMLIDEGLGDQPAIVPFHASQIKIIKNEIIRPEDRKFGES